MTYSILAINAHHHLIYRFKKTVDFCFIYPTTHVNIDNKFLKTLLGEGLSEPEFYGVLVYKFKKLIGMNDFSFQFRNKSLHVIDA